MLAAATGAHPEITIVVTNEMYRCSVVGQVAEEVEAAVTPK